MLSYVNFAKSSSLSTNFNTYKGQHYCIRILFSPQKNHFWLVSCVGSSLLVSVPDVTDTAITTTKLKETQAHTYMVLAEPGVIILMTSTASNTWRKVLTAT